MKNKLSLSGLMLLAMLMSSISTKAQPVLEFSQVVTGLSNPVDIADPGDGRLFIVQQGGLIRIWNGSVLTTFLNISGLITSPTGSEQGLLSMAFHPQYSSNRYFFVWYTGTGGLLTLARYRRDAVDPNVADPASAQVLLTIPKPGTPAYTNHNGAKLNFGTDGMLYIGTGDGGSGGDPFNNAQNGASLLGKLLRIDVNSFATSAPFYNIPPDNPYASPVDGILDEIYATGLRNPWRWSFDRLNGDIWIGDVGQGLWEEVNWMAAGSFAGANFGWRCYEGAHPYSGGGCTPPGTVFPVFEYGHNSTTGGFSITGGYVYRGAEYPGLQGYYITADYVSGNVWTIRPNGADGWSSNMQSGLPSNISSFGESSDGTLYAVKRNTGVLYKIVLASVIPVTVTRFSGKSFDGYNLLQWTSEQEGQGVIYQVECSRNGIDFNRIAAIPGGHAPGVPYTFRHEGQFDEKVFYRLSIAEPDGRQTYSNILMLKIEKPSGYSINPNIINGSQLFIQLHKKAKWLQVYQTNGAKVLQRNMEGLSGNVSINLPATSKGEHIVVITGDDGYWAEKIFVQ